MRGLSYTAAAWQIGGVTRVPLRLCARTAVAMDAVQANFVNFGPPALR